ncbi:hypothetical protein ColTof4_14342 [Colletotrichum tofieldiae]|nr:hypothetical protein ColTof3_14753 [Colletotrichum tofieldiae]GKT81919.1 hypothetical protein ColTof4_14342 [Colletotrichum tofieldiae]
MAPKEQPDLGSTQPAPVASRASLPAFTGGRAITAGENLAKRHTNEEQRISTTATQARAARQILRFLDSANAALTQHRQNGRAELERLDPGLGWTKRAAAATPEEKDEPHWLPSWDKGPGMLKGYIAKNFGKWLDPGQQPLNQEGLVDAAPAPADTPPPPSPPSVGPRPTMVRTVAGSSPSCGNTLVPDNPADTSSKSCVVPSKPSPPLAAPGAFPAEEGEGEGDKEIATRRLESLVLSAEEDEHVPEVLQSFGQAPEGPRAEPDTIDFPNYKSYRRRVNRNPGFRSEPPVESSPPVSGIDPDWYDWYRRSRGHARN